MKWSSVIVSVPTADLRRSFRFYREGLGLELAVPTDGDDMPEPVEFLITDQTRLMVVPSDGFGWVIGHNEVAAAGVSECVIGVGLATEADVDDLVRKAAAAGGAVVTPPGPQPWGYSGAFSDPDGHIWIVTVTDAPLSASR